MGSLRQTFEKRRSSSRLNFRRAILSNSMYQSLLLVVFVVGGSLGALKGSDYKKVVEYEGNIFVLHSGCPEIQCQRLPQLDYCKKRRDDYEKCMRTEDGPLPGCITERLGDGAELTIPVMASYCSRHCYLHHKRDQLDRVEKCPHRGKDRPEIDPATLVRAEDQN